MKNMILAVICAMVFCPAAAFAHCQIPCGIYDDDMRLKMIEEDILTVEKSMNEINRLSAEEKKDYNQIVRWIDNKEHHADKISETATYYFMAQRVSPVGIGEGEAYAKYTAKLALLHELVVYSMKAKQTTDLSYAEKMRDALGKFREAYSR